MNSFLDRHVLPEYHGGTLYNAFQNTAAPNYLEKNRSAQQCANCRAAALDPELLESMVALCRAIIRGKSDSSSNAIQCNLQNLQDVDQTCSQRSVGIEQIHVHTCNAAANDKDNGEEHASEEVKDGVQNERNRHFRCAAETRCTSCKMRRVKCDEGKPSCRSCTKSGLKCKGYELVSAIDADYDKYFASRTGGNLKDMVRHDYPMSASGGYPDPNLGVGKPHSIEGITSAYSEMSLCSTLDARGTKIDRRLLDVTSGLLTLKEMLQPEMISVIARYHPQLHKGVAKVLIGLALELCKLAGLAMTECQRTLTVAGLFADAINVERDAVRSLQRGRVPSQHDMISEIERGMSMLTNLAARAQDWVADLDDYILVPQQHISTCCVWNAPTGLETERTQGQLSSFTSSPKTCDPHMDWDLVDSSAERHDTDPPYPFAAPPGPSRLQRHDFDTTGQTHPAGMKPRVTVVLWEDEGTLCFSTEALGVVVSRREDNHFINGSNLLDVARRRGRQPRNFESERIRHVVHSAPENLEGTWIPFDRALDFANQERITDILYPLFVHNIGALLYSPHNTVSDPVHE